MHKAGNVTLLELVHYFKDDEVMLPLIKEYFEPRDFLDHLYRRFYTFEMFTQLFTKDELRKSFKLEQFIDVFHTGFEYKPIDMEILKTNFEPSEFLDIFRQKHITFDELAIGIYGKEEFKKEFKLIDFINMVRQEHLELNEMQSIFSLEEIKEAGFKIEEFHHKKFGKIDIIDFKNLFMIGFTYGEIQQLYKNIKKQGNYKAEFKEFETFSDKCERHNLFNKVSNCTYNSSQ